MMHVRVASGPHHALNSERQSSAIMCQTASSYMERSCCMLAMALQGEGSAMP